MEVETKSRKRKTVVWRDEEEENGKLTEESVMTVDEGLPPMCIVCGEEALLRENMKASVTKLVRTVAYNVTGGVADVEGHMFCSTECQLEYYTYTLKRDTEEIEAFKRRVFYMERLFESVSMRKKYESLNALETQLLGEALVGAYVTENRPSLMALATNHSVMLSGRSLVHVAGDNTHGALGIRRSFALKASRMQPILVEGVTSVYAANNYTLLLSIEAGTLMMSGTLKDKKFTGVETDEQFTLIPCIKDVIHVACNEHLICVLRSNGSLWVSATDRDSLYFTDVETDTVGNDFVSVVLTGTEILALRVDGTLWSSLDRMNTVVHAFSALLVAIRCDPGGFVVARARNDMTWVRSDDGVFHPIDSNRTHEALKDTDQMVLRSNGSLHRIEDGHYATKPMKTDIQSYCSSDYYDSVMYRRHDGVVYARGENRSGKLGLGVIIPTRKQAILREVGEGEVEIDGAERVLYVVPLRELESGSTRRRERKDRRAAQKRQCRECGTDAHFSVMGLSSPHYVCDSPSCLHSVYDQ